MRSLRRHIEILSAVTGKGKYSSLLRNIFLFGAGTFLTKLVQFLLLPLYTGCLSPEAYASGELLNNFVELAYPLGTLCICDAVFRFVMSRQSNRREVVSCAVEELLVLGAVVLLGGGVVYFISGSWLAWGFSALFLTYCARQLFAFYARGADYSFEFAASGVINAVALALSSWLFISVFTYGAVGYVAGLVIGNAISALYLSISTDVLSNVVVSVPWRHTLLWEMLAYSLPLVAYNTAFWISAMSGRYILAYISGAESAGLFLAITKLAAVINMVQQVFYYAFQINSSKEYEAGEDVEFMTRAYWAFSALLIMFCSLLLCVMPSVAPLILKGEFVNGAKYLPLTLYAAFVDCLFCYFKSLYAAYKQTARSARSTIVGAVVNIAICFLLIPALGIWGALVALLASYIAAGVIRCFDAKAFVPIDQRWRTNLPAIVMMGIQTACLSTDMDMGQVAAIGLCVAVCLFLLISYRSELKAFLN